MLYQWLMNQEKLSSLFTTMSEMSAKKLCKEMEFLHLNSGEVVVNQGEKGSTCFILMSGVVSVYVRSPEEQIRYQRIIRSSSISSSMRRLSGTTSINYGNKVITLTPGATFGELCLIEPDSKRSATVIVDPQAQMANFIVLTAASYLRMTRSQTIEGTITDNIAFLQHLLIFKHWTKMQLMHIVNSMKLVNVSAGQYLTRKGSEADSFFVFLRGEAVESVNLTVNESSEMSMGEARGVQRSITVELTFLGKFDVAGEYIASEKKVSLCPVDIRATTDVDCLMLTRKLFMLHFGGDQLCMELPLYYMLDEKQKKREQKERGRTTSNHRISVAPQSPTNGSASDASRKLSRKPTMSAMPSRTDLPALREHDREGVSEPPSPVRLGMQLVTKQWQEAGKSRALRLPQRPMTTPSGKRAVPLAVTSITHSTHVSRRQEDQRRQLTQRKTRPIQEELQYIRDTWPYCWNNDDDGQQDATTGMLARLRSRSRSPSPTLDRRRSQPGRHDSGSLSART
ncbi:hypothetical protein PF011_g1140 [Phytophthora fragariae]|uniref:Cyclic nucleotide-binding domain-containing protein n=1 Tax=Phytophthora fragariae TaxID=53985 RepID=A0A6A3MIP5_9STRA|nr:hypothetical protein PF011_g1140 [Phytophthora fragariae]